MKKRKLLGKTIRITSVFKQIFLNPYFFGIIICLFIGTSCKINQSKTIIHVKDFGAIPNDGKDDSEAIQRAFDEAVKEQIKQIMFDEGRYDIIAIMDTGNNAHISLKGISDLKLLGEVNREGEPTTRIVRHWNMPAERVSEKLLYIGDCPDLVMHNFLFDNSPQYCTAGKVVEKTDSVVIVEILEGLPRIDNVGCFCANLWDLSSRRLKNVPSVTYGSEVNEKLSELTWHMEGGGNGRRMRLNSPTVASQVQIGDGLSWNFGWGGDIGGDYYSCYQVLFEKCDRLNLENIKTVNAIGFAMRTNNSKGITANKVEFRPEGNQLAVGPRDGWKLSGCDGIVKIQNMHIEGVRWDGQNVHGRFIDVLERKNNNSLMVGFPEAIPAGDTIDFWDGSTKIYSCKVKSCIKQASPSPIQWFGKRWQWPMFELVFSDTLPDFIAVNTLACPKSWDIDSYSLYNCSFSHIAGAASIIRNAHAEISNCSFENIMYPAVTIASSIKAREGPFPQDITIKECIFDDCGWETRLDASGMIGINSWGGELPYMGKVVIKDNTFKNGETGIAICEIQEVEISNNSFENIKKLYSICDTMETKLIYEGNMQKFND